MIDRRIRLRPRPAAQDYVYGDLGDTKNPTILSFLRSTNGMVWNYTPIVSESRQVNYETEQPVHSNSSYNNYKSTSNTNFAIQGELYANTATEAMYLLSCLHFIRSVSLMDFGRKAAANQVPNRAVVGAAPPILLLSGYGRYVYNDIPVILKSYQINLANDVSYIQVPVNTATSIYDFTEKGTRQFFNQLRSTGYMNADNEVWVPQKVSLTIQLEEQPTSDFMTKQFNLNDYKTGKLLRKGGFI